MNFSISPGRITALWVVLRTTSKHEKISLKNLSSIAKNTSLRGGGLPIDDGIDIGINAGLLYIKNKTIRIQKNGKDIVDSWDKEEPNKKIIRELLKIIVINSKPPWTTFIAKPMEERVYAIPSNWIEVLNNADLIKIPLSDDAKQWWQYVQKSFEAIEEDLRAKIGDIGESHSIHFEKNRLISCKEHDLADKIKWVSKISDNYGFDISSFYGNLNITDLEKDEEICIEVKSSIMESKSSFYFILTKNEWNTALYNSENYFFHLWRKVRKLTHNSYAEGPLIISAKKIDKLIPKNQQKDSYWLKCRIKIDYELLKDDLLDPNKIL